MAQIARSFRCAARADPYPHPLGCGTSRCWILTSILSLRGGRGSHPPGTGRYTASYPRPLKWETRSTFGCHLWTVDGWSARRPRAARPAPTPRRSSSIQVHQLARLLIAIRPVDGDAGPREFSLSSKVEIAQLQKPGNLRRRRLLAGVTLTELARHLGASPSFVSNAERGLVKITPELMRRFKEALSLVRHS